jgi:uncharacterized protein YdhG (YjbR/CyaY superfamily)
MATPESVDEYLAGLPADQRGVLEMLRRTMKAAAPKASETISYRIPAFKDEGRLLVWYAAFKDHYSVYPASQGVKEALGKDLTPYFSGKGTIRFEWDKPIPTALVKRIVKARQKENAAIRPR